MVRAGNLKRSVMVLAFTLVTCTTSLGADNKTLRAISDIQQSERLIAAALATGDANELRDQSRAISRLIGILPNTISDDSRVECAFAAQHLFNITLDFQDLPPARREIALRRDLGLYREAMPSCEATAGAQAPEKPNLR